MESTTDVLVEDLMSPLPHVIAPSATIAEAEAIMRDAAIHHLPVIEGQSLVGLLTARDLAVAANVSAEAPQAMTVREVITSRPVTVAQGTKLSDVVAVMLDERVGVVVVVHEGRVIGILTHHDVFRHLGEKALGTERPSPEEIRRRVVDEHRRIAVLLDKLEGLARQLGGGDEGADPLLRRAVFELHEVMRHHMAYEERTLLPALRDADSFGPARVAAFVREHQAQRSMLENIATELAATESSERLTVGVLELVRAIRDDMETERREFLDPELLRDSVVRTDFGG
jgi:acetoin utilization protein AcuB